jgi:hypothetical protein
LLAASYYFLPLGAAVSRSGAARKEPWRPARPLATAVVATGIAALIIAALIAAGAGWRAGTVVAVSALPLSWYAAFGAPWARSARSHGAPPGGERPAPDAFPS